METPSYIKSIVIPTTNQPQGRKVWSIDLEQVWVKFFTATNAQGDTALPSEALGCPLRLGYDKTGAVRFSPSGRPVIRVAKELANNIRFARDNYIATLRGFTESVIRDNADGYKAQVELAYKAGLPIKRYEENQLANALKAKAEAVAQAEAVAEAKAEAEAEAVKSKGRKVRELVPA